MDTERDRDTHTDGETERNIEFISVHTHMYREGLKEDKNSLNSF